MTLLGRNRYSMNIFRPSDGFRVTVEGRVLQVLDQQRDRCPWLQQAYDDAVLRLRMTGHREGVALSPGGDRRTVTELDPTTRRKRLGITYTVIADRLKIVAIRVLADNRTE